MLAKQINIFMHPLHNPFFFPPNPPLLSLPLHNPLIPPPSMRILYKIVSYKIASYKIASYKIASWQNSLYYKVASLHLLKEYSLNC
jgi:hypothetical protein